MRAAEHWLVLALAFTIVALVLLLLRLYRRGHGAEARTIVRSQALQHRKSDLTEMVRLQRLTGTPRSSRHAVGSDDGKSESEDSFYSCCETDLEQGSARPLRRPVVPKRARQNRNAVTDYRWLQDLLEHITEGKASLLGCTDNGSGERCAPLFVVAGTCPSVMPPSPMQAMLYSARPGGSVDFWFVKPEAKNRGSIDWQTLSRHPTGKFRNVPLRSKDLFMPLAARFSGEGSGAFTYSVDAASGRAVIEERVSFGRRRRMLVYFVWIENYKGGRKPFVEGKMCYQRQEVGVEARPQPAEASVFYTRQFKIQDDVVHLVGHQDEELLTSLMPSDAFQEMV